MDNRFATRRGFVRWTLGAGTAFPAIDLIAREARAAELTLLVFVHTDARVRSFEKQLATALPGVNVRAVGRYRDFEASLQNGADAVVTLQPVLDYLKLPVTSQGKQKGKSQEPYVLVSAGALGDPKRIGMLGAVDILGHAGMKAFVAQVAGVTPKIKLVTKTEDLLPLLQLQVVDAVLAPERFFPSLRESTRIDLHQLPVGSAGLPAFAALTAPGHSVGLRLSKLPATINAQMGVTEWV